MEKPKVLVTSLLPEEVAATLTPHATLIQGTDQAKALPRDKVLEYVGEVTAIINQGELAVDAELLDRAKLLKVVANTSAGFDKFDIAAMRSHGVIGCNCPESYSADTATHTFGLLLAVTRRLFEADAYVRSGQWQRDGWMPGGRWDGMSLTGKRLGLIGYGHIGRQMAQRARAFGMVVHHHTRTPTGEEGWLPLPELLADSDVISLHCPLNDSTRHLINADTLGQMKQDAILLNVSRGPVVRIDDLIATLKRGHLRGAGLDVFEFEPEVPADLRAMPNVVLSPHMGGCTTEARAEAWALCIENVIRVLSGEAPKTPAFRL